MPKCDNDYRQTHSSYSCVFPYDFLFGERESDDQVIYACEFGILFQFKFLKLL